MTRRKTVAAAPPAIRPESRGRPPTDTVALHLRLPRDLDAWLQDKAIEESGRLRKTITKQAVIVTLLEKAKKGSR